MFVGHYGKPASTTYRALMLIRKGGPKALDALEHLCALPERSEAAREDLPKVLALLAQKKIDPMIAKTFPLLEARKALELLVAGGVEGKVVLEVSER